MAEKKKNFYEELAGLDVSRHVEKKGKFSYLSWAWAVDQLRRHDPTATWEVKRFDGVPYLKTELGYFVEVEVTVQGVTLSQIHPVLNNYNKPIPQPTPFDINTSIQRCLVKAIALHGLGLFIYAGEDLPVTDGDNDLSQIANQSRENVQQQEGQEEQAAAPEGKKNVKVATAKQKGLVHQRMREILELVEGTEEGLLNSLRERIGDFESIDNMTSLQASKAIEQLTKWKTQYSNR